MRIEPHGRGVSPVQASLPVSPAADKKQKDRPVSAGKTRQIAAKPRNHRAVRGGAPQETGRSEDGPQIDLKV